MYLIRKSHDLVSLNTCVRFYSLARKSHYDVLNLRRNCSDKEIKEAFIQMSKEYHPDKNKDSKAQEKFVRIVEAYNVLGKPGTRAQYDHSTEIHTSTSSTASSYAPYNVYRQHNVRHNPNFSSYYQSAQTNTKSEKVNNGDSGYYGFGGLRKLPNYYIICLCFGVAFFGVLIQLVVIRNTYAVQRMKAQERSLLLAEELNRVRAAAKENGNELQTRLLLEKIVTAANPTVTTASLGQALASEKKDTTETLLTEFGVSEMTDEWYEIDEEKKVNLHDVIRKIMSYMC